MTGSSASQPTSRMTGIAALAIVFAVAGVGAQAVAHDSRPSSGSPSAGVRWDRVAPEGVRWDTTLAGVRWDATPAGVRWDSVTDDGVRWDSVTDDGVRWD